MNSFARKRRCVWIQSLPPSPLVNLQGSLNPILHVSRLPARLSRPSRWKTSCAQRIPLFRTKPSGHDPADRLSSPARSGHPAVTALQLQRRRGGDLRRGSFGRALSSLGFHPAVLASPGLCRLRALSKGRRKCQPLPSRGTPARSPFLRPSPRAPPGLT